MKKEYLDILKKLFKPVKDDSAYDAKELALGIEIELEHTGDKDIAKWIAKHHLDEFEKYYSEILIPAEKKAEKREKMQKVVVAFLKKNPNPSDDEVHKLAEKHDCKKDTVEEMIYELASEHARMHKSRRVLALVKAKKKMMTVGDAMKHSDKLGAGAKKRKQLTSKDDKFEAVMREFKNGTLHSSDGKIVTDRDVALAIAYSESGKGKK